MSKHLFVCCEICKTDLFRLMLISALGETHLIVTCAGCEGSKDMGEIDFPEGDILPITGTGKPS